MGLVSRPSSEVTFISRITYCPQYFLCSQSLAGCSSSDNSPAGILTPLPRFCGARGRPRRAAPAARRTGTRAASPCCAGRWGGVARRSPAAPRPAVPPAVLGRPGLSFRAVTGAAARSPAGRPAPVCGLEAAGPGRGSPLSVRGAGLRCPRELRPRDGGNSRCGRKACVPQPAC